MPLSEGLIYPMISTFDRIALPKKKKTIDEEIHAFLQILFISHSM